VLKLKKADKKPVLTTRMLLPYYKLEAVSPRLFYDAFYPFVCYFRSTCLRSVLCQYFPSHVGAVAQASLSLTNTSVRFPNATGAPIHGHFRESG
jgi:hypothetical protein